MINKDIDCIIPHEWDKDGERCLKCGDKDWFASRSCGVPDLPNDKGYDHLNSDRISEFNVE